MRDDNPVGAWIMFVVFFCVVIIGGAWLVSQVL